MANSTNKIIKAIQKSVETVANAAQYQVESALLITHLEKLENLAAGKGIGRFSTNKLSPEDFDRKAEEVYQEINKHFSTSSDNVLGAFLFLPAQITHLIEMACGVIDVQTNNKHNVQQIVVAYIKAVYSAGAAAPLVLKAATSFFKGMADLFPKRSFIEKMFSKWADKIEKLAENVTNKIKNKVEKLDKEDVELKRLLDSEHKVRTALQRGS